MAVLNITPDSFFDGGQYVSLDRARARIDEVLEEGCDVIDIGAESTRPGSHSVSTQEQIDRSAATIEYAVSVGASVSIDTANPKVAEQALKLGARIVNDVSCLADPRLARVVFDGGADLIIMHSRGSMEQTRTSAEYAQEAYSDVVGEVASEWKEAEARALACGLEPRRIWFDPGLGFHKNAEHCGTIMRRLDDFSDLGAGMVLGASRKSFIGALDASPPERRLGGSIAACLRALNAGVKVLRVHDVQEARQALIAYSNWEPSLRLEEASFA
jgi:dihydropteroate synthase